MSRIPEILLTTAAQYSLFKLEVIGSGGRRQRGTGEGGWGMDGPDPLVGSHHRGPFTVPAGTSPSTASAHVAILTPEWMMMSTGDSDYSCQDAVCLVNKSKSTRTSFVS